MATVDCASSMADDCLEHVVDVGFSKFEPVLGHDKNWGWDNVLVVFDNLLPFSVICKSPEDDD